MVLPRRNSPHLREPVRPPAHDLHVVVAHRLRLRLRVLGCALLQHVAHAVFDVCGHDANQTTESLGPRHGVLVPPLVHLPVRLRIGGDLVESRRQRLRRVELLEVHVRLRGGHHLQDFLAAVIHRHGAADEGQPHLLGGIPGTLSSVLHRKVKHVLRHEALEGPPAVPARGQPLRSLRVVLAPSHGKHRKLVADRLQHLRAEREAVHGQPRQTGNASLPRPREKFVIAKHGSERGSERPPDGALLTIEVRQVIQLSQHVAVPIFPSERPRRLVREEEIHLVLVRLMRELDFASAVPVSAAPQQRSLVEHHDVGSFAVARGHVVEADPCGE